MKKNCHLLLLPFILPAVFFIFNNLATQISTSTCVSRSFLALYFFSFVLYTFGLPFFNSIGPKECWRSQCRLKVLLSVIITLHTYSSPSSALDGHKHLNLNLESFLNLCHSFVSPSISSPATISWDILKRLKEGRITAFRATMDRVRKKKQLLPFGR